MWQPYAFIICLAAFIGCSAGECDYQTTITCDTESVYRTEDGTCNNLETNARWGSADIPFSRFMDPVYTDGDWAPKKLGVGDGELPGPRSISVTMHGASTAADLSSHITHMTMIFGQFLTHDLTEDLLMKGPDGKLVICALESSRTDFPEICELAIPVPENDPTINTRRDFLSFGRSETTDALDCTSSPRQQTNGLTSFIDLSNTYGASRKQMSSLRHDVDGLMKTSATSWGDITLPQASSPGICVLEPGEKCFQVGDGRGNQQPGLTSMHTIWVRYHNLVAGELKRLHETWNNKQLFNEARKITGAIMQHITYDQYLKVVLGEEKMNEYGLKLLENGYFTEYSSTEDPSIKNGFAAAGFRFGHSQIDDGLLYVHANGTTTSKLFVELWKRPHDIYDENIGVDSVIRGLLQSKAQKADRLFTTSVTTSLLSTSANQFADLVSLNIQRGRDHGLPAYDAWRSFCGLSVPTDFSTNASGFVDHDSANAALLESLYSDTEDVDLYPAGMTESALSGALVGPTFACIIGKQFHSLRYGDRFWYENDGTQAFTEGELAEIRKMTMSRVICDTTGVASVQPNIFFSTADDGNAAVNCDTIPNMDFDAWL